jgi:hypothetical protein
MHLHPSPDHLYYENVIGEIYKEKARKNHLEFFLQYFELKREKNILLKKEKRIYLRNISESLL